jgi:hypothetical protein
VAEAAFAQVVTGNLVLGYRLFVPDMRQHPLGEKPQHIDGFLNAIIGWAMDHDRGGADLAELLDPANDRVSRSMQDRRFG